MIALMVISIPEWLYQFLKNENINKTSDGIEYFGVYWHGVQLQLKWAVKRALLNEIPNNRVIDRNKKIGTLDKKGNIYVYIGCKYDLSKKKGYVVLEDIGAKRVLQMLYAIFDIELLQYVTQYKSCFGKQKIIHSSTTLLIKSFMEINGIEVNTKNYETISKRLFRRK